MYIDTTSAVLPPERSGRYLCYTEYGEWLVLDYSKRHKAWNVIDAYTAEEVEDRAIDSVLVWGALEKDKDKIIKEAF